MLRWFKRLILGSVFLTVSAAVAYSFTDGFSQRWRGYVIRKLEERHIFLDFEKLGLSILRGLVVRDVRVFADASRTQLLMSVDELDLDLDYGRLLERQFFVEGVDVSDTNLSLPLDPDDSKAGHLELSRFNARVLMTEDRVEIRRAEGDLAGVHLIVTGALRIPQKFGDDVKKEKKEPKPKVSFVLTREHRQMIQHSLRWLDRFNFSQRPVVALDIDGSLDRPDELRAEVHLSAKKVGYENYVCEELSGTAEYHDHLLDVRRLTMRDKIGTFEASATWPLESDEVQFTVNTSADLPQLARSFFASEELREIVFYDSVPSLSLEGKWFVRGPKATPRRPVEALGSVKFGRFTTRGEVFDGMSANFGVSPNGYYIRDALLRHKTGTLSLQAMSLDTGGFKYRAVLRMDPHAFLPFAGSDAAREGIRRFEFDEHSTIFAQLEGEGKSSSILECSNLGRLELREFKYRGIEFESLTTDVTMQGSKQFFNNIEVHPSEGSAYAQQLELDLDGDYIKLSGVKAQLDPVPILSCFTRPVAEHVSQYRFGPKTKIEAGGVIGLHGPKLDNYAVHFDADGSSAVYELWERDYSIRNPKGLVTIVGEELGYDVKGKLFGGDMSAKGHVQLGPGTRYDLKLKADEFRHVVMSKDLPFHDLTVDITEKNETSPFDISAEVLGGTMTLKGMMDLKGKTDSYRGELRLNGMPFHHFAGVYAPGNETEGDITGHFDFSGKVGDWKALKGSGVLIILNGNLYALPILGPLTPLLGSVLPPGIKNYNVAKEANCNFTVADGFVVTKDFEALTTTFKLVAEGRLDFINDEIDFVVQARARGLPGLVLRPVSELLEYKGTGSLSNPKWRPHVFGLTDDRKNNERKPPSKSELEAAQKEAQQAVDLRERLKRAFTVPKK